jgi:type IV secretory pathway protease TraF
VACDVALSAGPGGGVACDGVSAFAQVGLPIADGRAYDVRVGQMVTFCLEHTETVDPASFRAFHGIAFYNKRVAALGGDTVDFQNMRVRVPEGHFWALGDNSSQSHDSRAFGAVPLSNLRSVHLVYVDAKFPFRLGLIAGTDLSHALRNIEWSALRTSFCESVAAAICNTIIRTRAFWRAALAHGLPALSDHIPARRERA